MRRIFIVYAFCCGVALLAAAPRSPVPPTPTPRPSATVNLNLSSLNPTVLIYPFDTAGGLDAKVGTQVATIFSREFTTAGNVNILPVPSGIQRAALLTNARARKADYYITGYVTPIGDSISVVVQVVSVQSGVIVFAQTAQVYGVNDARSIALACHDAVLQLSGTNVSVTTTESATAAPSAAPTNGAQFSLGHLFAHHGRTAAPVTPMPSAKPSRGVIIIAVHSQSALPASELSHATTLLEHDLAAHFAVRNGGGAPTNLHTAADSICGADRDNTIATGTLVLQRIGGLRPHTKSIFTLQVWTCFGDVLYQTTASDFDIAKAISSAVSDYVTTHPSNG
ncbi:MAG: hypothetical protein ACYC8W_04370 [Candidatus Tyrphobacter sp.]